MIGLSKEEFSRIDWEKVNLFLAEKVLGWKLCVEVYNLEKEDNEPIAVFDNPKQAYEWTQKRNGDNKRGVFLPVEAFYIGQTKQNVNPSQWQPHIDHRTAFLLVDTLRVKWKEENINRRFEFKDSGGSVSGLTWNAGVYIDGMFRVAPVALEYNEHLPTAICLCLMDYFREYMNNYLQKKTEEESDEVEVLADGQAIS